MDRNFVAVAARLRKELYEEYGAFYYVPMAESRSVQLPVTVGCSYGRCLFCDLNHGLAYRELSCPEIRDKVGKLRFLHQYDRRPVRRCLLSGGNPFFLPAEKLLWIAGELRGAFPECESVSCFARADDVMKKSAEELETLHAAGYDRLCLGIESGSERVLRYHEKGVGRAGNAEAMRKLDAAGISYSVYVILGLGGRALSDEHIAETASLLNGARPFELTVVNLVTQIGLNVALNIINYRSGPMSFTFYYVLMELGVFVLEAILYANPLHRFSGQPKPESANRTVGYALTANAASFAIGLWLAHIIPGIF